MKSVEKSKVIYNMSNNYIWACNICVSHQFHVLVGVSIYSRSFNATGSTTVSQSHAIQWISWCATAITLKTWTLKDVCSAILFYGQNMFLPNKFNVNWLKCVVIVQCECSMTEKGAEFEENWMDMHDDDPTHQPCTSRTDVILKNHQVTIQGSHAAFHNRGHWHGCL
jgi:hypothetical protein